MNLYQIFLKSVRKIYKVLFKRNETITFGETDPNKSDELIYDLLKSENTPCMIARIGSTELTCLCNYIGVKESNKNPIKFITGKVFPFWWEQNIVNQMQNWSGFFPPTENKIEEFCQLMLTDMEDVDILGSWLKEELFFQTNLKKSRKVHLRLLEPFWSDQPWTRVLEGKKVLIVHPFAKTILNQYKKREFLFNNKNTLPEFKSIEVIQAVQSLGVGDSRFRDWFEALNFMKNEIDKTDYDICLIGAGAYGFPLGAHVKRSGKKAVHMGGALQLLFGIKGKRWEDPNYGVSEWGIEYGAYANLMNKHWVRPDENEKPVAADSVEGACYW